MKLLLNFFFLVVFVTFLELGVFGQGNMTTPESLSLAAPPESLNLTAPPESLNLSAPGSSNMSAPGSSNNISYEFHESLAELGNLTDQLWLYGIDAVRLAVGQVTWSEDLVSQAAQSWCIPEPLPGYTVGSFRSDLDGVSSVMEEWLSGVQDFSLLKGCLNQLTVDACRNVYQLLSKNSTSVGCTVHFPSTINDPTFVAICKWDPPASCDTSNTLCPYYHANLTLLDNLNCPS